MTMASHRQNEANRNNAKRSTGPQTTIGKARSSRNALRHGLSSRNANHDPEFETVAATVLVEKALPIVSQDIARVKLELSQIRRVRARMLETLLKDLDPKRLNDLLSLFRYERAAFASQKRLLAKSEN